MTATSAPATRSALAPRVFGAEVRRMARDRSTRITVILAVALGIAGIVGTAMLGADDSLGAVLSLRQANYVTIGPVMVMLAFCLRAAVLVPREMSDGNLELCRFLVPRPGLIVASRCLAWTLFAFACCLVASGLGAVPILLGAPGATTPFSTLLGSAVLAIIGCTAGSVLVHLAALALRRGAYIILAAMLLLIVLPLALMIAGLFVPQLSDAASWLDRYGLFGVLFGAMTLPEGARAVSGWLVDWLLLAVWVAVAAVFAVRSVTKL